MPSHTLLNVSPIPSTTGKKLGSCVWTSAKHLIEYGIRVKLRALGFAGKLLHWLADYLRNRSMKVILNGKSSSTKFINAGVPQGSILGPLLFIICIDDITLDISSTSILYADDVTLMSFIKSKEERIPAAALLNQELCNIEKWATSWNVLFGAAKCKTVTISNRQDAKDSHSLPPVLWHNPNRN